jgi:hypothetical protein
VKARDKTSSKTLGPEIVNASAAEPSDSENAKDKEARQGSERLTTTAIAKDGNKAKATGMWTYTIADGESGAVVTIPT